ncbi:MAG: hypothetical protein JKY95_04695, partial [Planctomycetaceae bacterium]|nr:hypothetical protein [Planctomycetaceae bacterium]
MPLLIAVGPEPPQKWEYPLSHQSKVRIGRFSESNQGVLWDLEVSRDHADIHWENGKYHVTCLENACNPIIAHGRSYKKIKLDVGGEFQIGKTHFRIVETDEDSEVRTMLSQTPDRPGEQTQYALRLADLRAELVSSCTSTLWTSSSEKHLAQHVIDILSKVILHADMIVLLECSLPDLKARKSPKILAKKSLARKQETAIDIPMIVAAIAKSKSVLKIRNETQNKGLLNENTGNGRWSFCTPIQSDDAHDWCVYAAGRFGEDLAMPSHLTTEDLNGDVAFTELVAQMLKAIRKVLMLEDRFAGIRQFFSPAVMKSVEKKNNDMSLEPTESETAILFCDLRGYSRVVEKGQENLKVLLEKVSNALGIMTQNIIKHDGVIADFQGDSALGFWGWPVPLSQGPLPACEAALE